jgi:hypothetical protein
MSVWGEIAGWVAALAAIGGLWFAGAQIRSARNIQREATANDIWMNYERLGLEYPKYANPELSVPDYKKRHSMESVRNSMNTSGLSLSCCWPATRYFCSDGVPAGKVL